MKEGRKMKDCKEIIAQIKKVEEANIQQLESQKKMIEDITKKNDYCENRDMSLEHYKIFLDELYKLFALVQGS